VRGRTGLLEGGETGYPRAKPIHKFICVKRKKRKENEEEEKLSQASVRQKNSQLTFCGCASGGSGCRILVGTPGLGTPCCHGLRSRRPRSPSTPPSHHYSSPWPSNLDAKNSHIQNHKSKFPSHVNTRFLATSISQPNELFGISTIENGTHKCTDCSSFAALKARELNSAPSVLARAPITSSLSGEDPKTTLRGKIPTHAIEAKQKRHNHHK
jgi:hypothetical protein